MSMTLPEFWACKMLISVSICSLLALLPTEPAPASVSWSAKISTAVSPVAADVQACGDSGQARVRLDELGEAGRLVARQRVHRIEQQSPHGSGAIGALAGPVAGERASCRELSTGVL